MNLTLPSGQPVGEDLTQQFLLEVLSYPFIVGSPALLCWNNLCVLFNLLFRCTISPVLLWVSMSWKRAWKRYWLPRTAGYVRISGTWRTGTWVCVCCRKYWHMRRVWEGWLKGGRCRKHCPQFLVPRAALTLFHPVPWTYFWTVYDVCFLPVKPGRADASQVDPRAAVLCYGVYACLLAWEELQTCSTCSGVCLERHVVSRRALLLWCLSEETHGQILKKNHFLSHV